MSPNPDDYPILRDIFAVPVIGPGGRRGDAALRQLQPAPYQTPPPPAPYGYQPPPPLPPEPSR